MQMSVTFEAKHAQISFCMPKTMDKYISMCTSMVTSCSAFWRILLARRRGNPPPLFDVANLRQNPMTSHFAEQPPPPLRAMVRVAWTEKETLQVRGRGLRTASTCLF